MSNNEIQTKIDRIHKLITNGEFVLAHRLLEDLDHEPKNYILESIKVALLIDIGNGLHDKKVIEKGIYIGKNLLKIGFEQNYSLAFIATLVYNLSNAYDALYKILEYGKVESIPLSNNLQESKSHLRLAISLIEYVDKDLAVQIYVNYGNNLDQLGRSVESIDAYEEALKINNKFSMALANKSKAELLFSQISGSYKIPVIINSYQKIKSVIDNPDLVMVGTIGAKLHFQNLITQIEKSFQNNDLLLMVLKHPTHDSSSFSEFEKKYISYCIKEKLFLNFHIHDEDCDAAIQDSIFINMRLSIKDTQTFDKYAVQINQLKEDYALARYHLFQSLNENDDIKSISIRTSFANTQYNSRFNLYNGLLKTAFKEAYNILDKIAVFINDYYNLGFNNKNIYFASIWENNNEMNKTLMNSKNLSIYALYDIFKDFKSDEYKLLKEIRNCITHRTLIITDKKIDILQENKINYEMFISETLKMLKLSKSSIIYLINFVNTEELKKYNENDKFLDIDVDTTQQFFI